MIEATGLRSGELAAAARVNVQTLRYYERRKLLPRPERTPGGHRLYPPETVTLLGVVKAAQRLGFTLDEVAELLDTGRRRHTTGALRKRAEDKLAEVDTKIEQLVAIRKSLSAVVDAGCDSLTDCTCPDCPLPFVDIALAAMRQGVATDRATAGTPDEADGPDDGTDRTDAGLGP